MAVTPACGQVKKEKMVFFAGTKFFPLILVRHEIVVGSALLPKAIWRHQGENIILKSTAALVCAQETPRFVLSALAT